MWMCRINNNNNQPKKKQKMMELTKNDEKMTKKRRKKVKRIKDTFFVHMSMSAELEVKKGTYQKKPTKAKNK